MHSLSRTFFRTRFTRPITNDLSLVASLLAGCEQLRAQHRGGNEGTQGTERVREGPEGRGWEEDISPRGDDGVPG